MYMNPAQLLQQQKQQTTTYNIRMITDFYGINQMGRTTPRWASTLPHFPRVLVVNPPSILPHLPPPTPTPSSQQHPHPSSKPSSLSAQNAHISSMGTLPPQFKCALPTREEEKLMLLHRRARAGRAWVGVLVVRMNMNPKHETRI